MRFEVLTPMLIKKLYLLQQDTEQTDVSIYTGSQKIKIFRCLVNTIKRTLSTQKIILSHKHFLHVSAEFSYLHGIHV